jgi:5S rRNA maturation endonuclease (ribonuclease M5)
VICLDAALYVVVERCSKKKELCILTDFDREGERLHAYLKTHLSERGVRILDVIREAVRAAGSAHVEGLASRLQEAKDLYR